MSNLHTLKHIAQEHGHKAEIVNGKLRVETTVRDRDGNTHTEVDEVSTLTELRDLLGY